MNHRLLPFLSLTLLTAALAGCSTTPAIVQTGDKVELGFTCRLSDGRVAATTSLDSTVSDALKSPFYLPRKGADTVTVLAGLQPANAKQDRLSFEDEILKQLAASLPGLRDGAQTIQELQAERYPAATPKDRFVHMATVRKRQKEMRLTREEYTTRTGKSPEVSQRLVIDPLVPGRVSEVTEKEVVVRFAPEQGKTLVTPFGPVTVRETPTHFELKIKVEKGTLVRTGGMVGRISEVTADSFVIDFGHPFGGEKLLCDVSVATVKPADKKHVAPESKPISDAASVSISASAQESAAGGGTQREENKAVLP